VILLLAVAAQHLQATDNAILCYQCAYSPQITRSLVINASRVIYETVNISRIVEHVIQVPTIVHQRVSVPRVVQFTQQSSRVVLDDAVVPKVISKEIRVPRIERRIIQTPYVVNYDEHVPRTSMQPITVSKLVQEPITLFDENGGSQQHYASYIAYVSKYQPVTEFDIIKKTRQIYDTEVIQDTVYDTITQEETIFDKVNNSKTVFSEETLTKLVNDVTVITKHGMENKTITETIIEPKQVSRLEFYRKSIPMSVSGGWDKCNGNFTTEEAQQYGIDTWQCSSQCYTRVDSNEQLYRGCFEEAYGVTPSPSGCSMQAGALWCFCTGTLCNNFDPK